MLKLPFINSVGLGLTLRLITLVAEQLLVVFKPVKIKVVFVNALPVKAGGFCTPFQEYVLAPVAVSVKALPLQTPSLPITERLGAAFTKKVELTLDTQLPVNNEYVKLFTPVIVSDGVITPPLAEMGARLPFPTQLNKPPLGFAEMVAL